jgi:hypothetical protein
MTKKLFGFGRALAPKVALATLVLWLAADRAFAASGIDLTSSIDTAGASLKTYAAKGVGYAGIVAAIIGLGHAAFKMMKQDPQSTWAIVCVVVGSVLFGVALSLGGV